MPAPRIFDHDEARRLYGIDGWTQSAIAERMGVSKRTVQGVCRGVDAAKDHRGINGRKNLGEWHIRARLDGMARRRSVLDLHSAGLKHSEIAARAGISTTRVGIIIAEDRAGRDLDCSKIEIPTWVPDFLHPTFLKVARINGEESAASHCRRLKAEAAASCR